MFGWEERSSTLIREPLSRPSQTVPYRTALFCKRIPGGELPGYLHLVPPGRNAGTLSTFSTPHQGRHRIAVSPFHVSLESRPAAAAIASRPSPDLTIRISSSSVVSEVDASITISPECKKLIRSHTSKT